MFRYTFLALALALFILASGCDRTHKRPDEVTQINEDTSLSDEKAVQRLAGQAFEFEFGDETDVKTGRDGIKLLIWRKDWRGNNMPVEKTKLVNPTSWTQEERDEAKGAKAETYREVAKQIYKMVDYSQGRPLKTIIVRLSAADHANFGSWVYLEVLLDSSKFAAFQEAVGEDNKELKDLDNEAVISTLDSFWTLRSDGFPKTTDG